MALLNLGVNSQGDAQGPLRADPVPRLPEQTLSSADRAQPAGESGPCRSEHRDPWTQKVRNGVRRAWRRRGVSNRASASGSRVGGGHRRRNQPPTPCRVVCAGRHRSRRGPPTREAGRSGVRGAWGRGRSRPRAGSLFHPLHPGPLPPRLPPVHLLLVFPGQPQVASSPGSMSSSSAQGSLHTHLDSVE